jgi:excisionase family DNA binding protein
LDVLEKTYSLQEAAQELGCTYRKVRDLVHGGHLRRFPVRGSQFPAALCVGLKLDFSDRTLDIVPADKCQGDGRVFHVVLLTEARSAPY